MKKKQGVQMKSKLQVKIQTLIWKAPNGFVWLSAMSHPIEEIDTLREHSLVQLEARRMICRKNQNADHHDKLIVENLFDCCIISSFFIAC